MEVIFQLLFTLFLFLFSKFGQLENLTLIERSRVSTTLPRVRNDNFLRGVHDGSWEFTTLEERNVETQVEHMLKAVVYVNPTVCWVSGISDRGEGGGDVESDAYRNFSVHSREYVWNVSAYVDRRTVHHPYVFHTAFSHVNGPQFSDPRT